MNRAFAREQMAIIFLGVDVVADALIACLASAMGPNSPAILIVLAILVTGLPAILAYFYGISARVAALSAPLESHARGTARSSLICLLFPLGFLIYAIVTSVLSRRTAEAVPMVAVGGSLVSLLAAVVTFGAVVNQTAIALRSKETSIWMGRMALTTVLSIVFVFGLLGGYAMLHSIFSGGYYYTQLPDGFWPIAAVLVAIATGIHLIVYHRMLATAREATRLGETVQP